MEILEMGYCYSRSGRLYSVNSEEVHGPLTVMLYGTTYRVPNSTQMHGYRAVLRDMETGRVARSVYPFRSAVEAENHAAWAVALRAP